VGELVPMTPEQQSRVTDNLALAAYVVHRLWKQGCLYVGERDEAQSLAEWGLCRSAQTYDSTRGTAFSTWACRCIRQVVIDGLNRSRPKRSTVTADLEGVASDRVETDGRALRDDLGRMLRSTSQMTRYILWRRYGDGASIRSIARELGYCEDRVRKRCKRGRMTLRRCFPNEIEGEVVA